MCRIYSVCLHCVKSVQIRSSSWSVFSCISLCILSKCEKIRTRKNSAFGHFSRSISLLTRVKTIITIIGNNSVIFHSWVFSKFYDFIWKKQFIRFTESFVVRYIFFVDITTALFLSFYQTSHKIVLLFIASLIPVITAFESSQFTKGEWFPHTIFSFTWYMSRTCISDTLFQISAELTL